MNRADRRQQQREQLLEGILLAVGEEGYEAASVRSVLSRTGLYRQAFYDNFADKDEGYLAAFDFGVERVAERLATAASSAGSDWRGLMRAGLAEFLAFCEDEQAVARALVVEVHVPGGEALRRRAAAMRRVAEFVDSARAELGDGEEQPPAITSEGIVAGIHAVIYARLATPADGEPELRALLPELMHLAVLPYFGAEAAAAEMQRAPAEG